MKINDLERNICDNCGMEIVDDHGVWIHISTLKSECILYAKPLNLLKKQCTSFIKINSGIYNCELKKHDHNIAHKATHYYTMPFEDGAKEYFDIIEW